MKECYFIVLFSDTMEEVNNAELDELEEEIDKLDELLAQAQLAKEVPTFQQFRADEDAKVAQLNNDISDLQKEVSISLANPIMY